MASFPITTEIEQLLEAHAEIFAFKMSIMRRRLCDKGFSRQDAVRLLTAYTRAAYQEVELCEIEPIDPDAEDN